MPALEAQTLDDLVTQCRLEPDLRQVFLEGNLDVSYFKWLFADLAGDPLRFQSINNVEVPAEVVRKHQQSEDNHGRVIALALELEIRDPSTARTVLCVPDGEYDYALARVTSATNVVYQDATSPEALSLNSDTLDKFRAIYLVGNAPTPAQMIASIEPLLRFLFAARAANIRHRWGLMWPPIKIRMGDDGVASLDRTEFIKSYSAAGPRLISPSHLQMEINEILNSSRGLPLEQAVRGHDIGLALGTVIRPFLRKELKDAFKAEMCESIMRACTDRSTIMAHECFALVRRFLSGGV